MTRYVQENVTTEGWDRCPVENEKKSTKSLKGSELLITLINEGEVDLVLDTRSHTTGGHQ